MFLRRMWSFSRIVAHRGGGCHVPENTLTAIEYGSSLGYRAVEFDVMLTRDKVPILMHDDTTGRTFKADKESISDLDYDELAQADAGSWFDKQYANVRIPKFCDVLQYCYDHNIWMNIEIKPAPGFDTETAKIVATMAKEFFQDKNTPVEHLPLFSSFSYESLLAAKEVAPEFKRGYLISNLQDVSDWKERCTTIGAYSVHVNHKYLTPELVFEIKERNLGLFCYTVNDVDRAKEIFSWGVDSFCTDKLLDFASFQT